MAFQIGFVDDSGSEGLAHWQMLLTIQALAEANGWTTLRYDDTANTRELILRGGLEGSETYIGLRAYHNVGADYYNLSVAGFTGYVPSNDFTAQPGYRESGIPAHNRHIDYWLAVNSQRVALAMKVGTPVYTSGYVGRCLPYALPGQYPYPLVVGGMLNGTPGTRYSDLSQAMPYKGNRANLALRFVSGAWLTPQAYPWNNTVLTGSTQLRDANGNYLLMPIVLCDGSNIYGELDGVYYVSGFDNVVESTMTIDGTEYVVIQNVHRTGFTDYYALRCG